MFKNKYTVTALAIYLNYIVVGVSVIILSLNMDSLMAQWGTDTTGFGVVTGGIGIGKFAVLFLAGMLSDKFGRKVFVMSGMFGFIICFAGMLYSSSVSAAIIFAIIAGMSNAFIDAGSYAALMEAYPKAAGTANLIVKVFVSFGQFVIPLLVSVIITRGMYYGISFYLLIGLLLLNLVFILRLKFPPLTKKDAKVQEESEIVFYQKPKLHLEGVALALYGYTATAGLTICQMWMQKIGNEVGGMSVNGSNAIVSYFSIGTLVSVFVTAALVKSKVRPAVITFVYPLISVAMSVVWYLFPTPLVCSIAGFVMGYSIAGGILQLAITSLAQFFPGNGGKCTGTVNSLNSIAIWTVPIITGFMAGKNMKNIIILIGAICLAGCLLGLVAMIRDRKVFLPSESTGIAAQNNQTT